MTVSFFGHSDAPEEAFEKAKTLLIRLIEKEGARQFYVGDHGNFDRIISRVLSELKASYPQIACCVVLAYMPHKNKEHTQVHLETMLPYEVAGAMPRLAIAKRNEWMLENSDLIVTWVCRSFGGAAQYKEMALKKGKRVIEIAGK